MVARIWHGYTSLTNAETYEILLKTEIFPGIEAKQLKGFKSIQLLKRIMATEVEFITIMLFSSLDNIKAFTGGDYETAYVPDKARLVLTHFDDRAQHYEIEDHRVYE